MSGENFLGMIPKSSQFPTDPFTGDGSTQLFTLSRNIAGNNSVLVLVGGNPQSQTGSSYNVTGNQLLFTEPPPKGCPIVVFHRGEKSSLTQPAPGSVGFTELASSVKSFMYQTLIVDGRTVYPLNYPAANSSSLLVVADGAVQTPDTDFTVDSVNQTISLVGFPANIKVFILWLGVVGQSIVPTAGSVISSSVDSTFLNKLLMGNKNKLINGNFDIWQRGTIQTTTAYGSADRWFSYYLGTTSTVTQQAFTIGQTDVPNEPTYFLRNSVSSVVGAGNYCYSGQAIESVRTLAGKIITLSFYAKADSQKNISIELTQYFGSNGSPPVNGLGSQLISLTTVWKKYTITVPLPSINGKLISGGNDCLILHFWFDAERTTYGTRSSNLGQQSGVFDISQVQIEEGNIASRFEDRSLGHELVLCQRYFEKSYPLNLAPGYNFGTVNALDSSGTMISFPSGTINGTYVPIRYSVRKRSVPTVNVYDNVGTINTISVASGSIPAVLGVSSNETGAYINHNGANTSQVWIGCHWIADSEL